MRKCVVVSDSFKGTLSSMEICSIAAKSIHKFFPECQVVNIPVADGGEGTVDSFLNIMEVGKKIEIETQNPFGKSINAYYALIENTAIIEMSSAAGLPLAEGQLDPCRASTYGVGILIKDAIIKGANKIIIGLGGSATNDGGCGCAAALGVVFKDKEGNSFIPTGGSLDKIQYIDTSAANELLRNISITAMCDIDNPLYGKTGAAYIFAPQKGASDKMVEFLDYQLIALDKAIKENLNKNVAQIPGSGAAGGMGAGVVAFLNGTLEPGIDIMLDTVDFDSRIKDADLIITGEGRLDSQSLRGKVISGVASRGKIQDIPVIAIVGAVEEDAYPIYDMGVTSIFSINRKPIPFSEARYNSESFYRATIEDILRLIKRIN
ncbi:glycerate kinase family protein [Paratissierella segnis]|uniref:Glycerate kinase n=1 Tax=Paratissierella segnis TaxID=2763679 RepID=A0A926ERI9_9FIRM|nr:glycerate kinase [Paratissierella segnis]MBC8587531.1 glycerate kinase [Paratissierella segnis]